MDDGSSSLGISFNSPPVGEAVLGLEFDPIGELGAIRLAQIASSWSPSRYPTMKEVAGIPPTPWNPDGSEPPFAVHVGPMPSRLWLLSADEADLLQLQNDRLIVNWRKMGQESAYPRHDALRSRLREHWDEFTAFLVENSLSTPRHVVLECTYVNTFDIGGDISSALSIFSRSTSDLPGEDEGVQFQVVRRLVEQGIEGRLVITGGPNPTQVPNMTRPYNLSVTAKVRGALEGGAFPEALTDSAHRFSVEAFAAITTLENHQTWGRQQ